jgi:dihydropteroate synthase
MRPLFTWRIGSRTLPLGRHTLVMGVLNVTPDSFFDGGLYRDPRRAVEHGLRLLDEGAAILDIGGESTRPGARVDAKAAAARASRRQPKARMPVPAEEEMRRILPVISELKRMRPRAVISVDTYKAVVARAAVEAGAEIVNDISGFRWDAEMAPTLAKLKCGAVLMHVRGRPEEWRRLPAVDDMVDLVRRELGDWARAAVAAGVARDRLVLDPGFGFGKNYQENYPLLARFEELHRLGFPLLAGPSRKSFVGRALRRGKQDAAPEARLFGSVAAAVVCIMKGAHIVRVHDVKATVETAAMCDAALGIERLSD